MFREFIKYRPWFGFNFGRPQRSISIEILNQAYGEWSRDGWITPHNSFLHIIYRAGILGVVFIISFFWYFFRLTMIFIRNKSIIGISLLGCLMYWIVVANFLVILELPYNAIPFWSLLGMTASFKDRFK
jgi:O-antigen ligase